MRHRRPRHRRRCARPRARSSRGRRRGVRPRRAPERRRRPTRGQRTGSYDGAVPVSILVVTWNNAGEIGACLDAALGQQGEPVEIVVVDNASADATPAVLDGYAGRVRGVRSAENLGYAAGNNLAYREASGEHVLLLNPDCVMAPDCLMKLR